MKKRKINSCSVIFSFAVIATGIYIVYKIVRSFQSPEAFEKIKELLQALGICIGFVLLVIACLSLYSYVTSILPPPRLKRRGKQYRVRGYPTEVEPLTDGSIPYYRNGTENLVSTFPVYCLASMTNYGLSLAAPPPDSSWHFISDENVSRFNDLSENHPPRIIIPMESMQLYYVVLQKMGDLTIQQAPARMHGYSGNIKLKPGMDAIHIIVIAAAMREAGNLPKLISRKKLIKLEMVALDETGQDDPAATRELYNAVYKDKNAQVERDDDFLDVPIPTYHRLVVVI